MIHISTEKAVNRRSAQENYVGATIVATGETWFAGMAGNIGLDRDTISGDEVFDRGVNSDDLSGGLMSKDMIGFDFHGADAA
jgi:hypothetical protein